MLKVDKKILIAILSLSLVLLGTQLYNIFSQGMYEGQKLLFQLLLIGALIIASVFMVFVVYIKIKEE